MAKDYILGMFTGIAIFGIITLLGWIITGKEAMGLGDIKFMGAIGLFFGPNAIVEISLLAFIVAAVFSILLILVRILILKKKDDYIAFGPFLSISAMICIFLPPNSILDTFLEFCSAISNTIL